MNRKKRPALLLVLTALLVTVCRCQPDVFSNNSYPMIFGDGVQAGSCKLFTEYFESKDNSTGFGAKPVWECEVPCPDGSVSKFDLYQQPQTFLSAKSDEEKAAFKAQYCSPEAMIPAGVQTAPIEAPIEAATETPTASPEPLQEAPIIIQPPNLLIIAPYLAGTVTACDTAQEYVNFPLFTPAPDTAGKTLIVTINSAPVKCAVAGTTSSLLSCTLPQNTAYPANVRVTLDGVEINNFNFNDSICTHILPPAATDEDNEDNPPPATEPPVPTEPPVINGNDNTSG